MNDCACVYVADGGFSCDFFREIIRTARKEHKCGECSRTIKPGEHYEIATGKWDGIICSSKTCSDCLSVRSSFFCRGYNYGGIWEDLAEHICEMGGQIDSSRLVPLTPVAREKVCEEIEQQWDDEED